MNIPENILQQVADAAFETVKATHLVSPKAGYDYAPARRAVIQHAISNPALAPFLAGVGGEYTDEEILESWRNTNRNHPQLASMGPKWMKAFLAALPRRESPSLAQAIARAEKAEAERDRLAERVAVLQERNVDLEGQRDAAMERIGIEHTEMKVQKELAEKAKAELAALKSAELGILRLPAAEATPPAQAKPDPYAELKAAHAEGKVIQVNIGKWVNPEAEDMWEDREEPAWDIYPEFYRIKPEPAAQVPLGPEDCPPGSVFRHYQWKAHSFRYPKEINEYGVHWTGDGTTHSQPHNTHMFEVLMNDGWQINTSLPDTGRWDANAWRPCSKPGKEVAK